MNTRLVSMHWIQNDLDKKKRRGKYTHQHIALTVEIWTKSNLFDDSGWWIVNISKWRNRDKNTNAKRLSLSLSLSLGVSVSRASQQYFTTFYFIFIFTRLPRSHIFILFLFFFYIPETVLHIFAVLNARVARLSISSREQYQFARYTFISSNTTQYYVSTLLLLSNILTVLPTGVGTSTAWKRQRRQYDRTNENIQSNRTSSIYRRFSCINDTRIKVLTASPLLRNIQNIFNGDWLAHMVGWLTGICCLCVICTGSTQHTHSNVRLP